MRYHMQDMKPKQEYLPTRESRLKSFIQAHRLDLSRMSMRDKQQWIFTGTGESIGRREYLTIIGTSKP